MDVRPSEYDIPCIHLQEAEGWACKPRKREIQNPGKGSKGKAQDCSGSAGLEGKQYWLDQEDVGLRRNECLHRKKWTDIVHGVEKCIIEGFIILLENLERTCDRDKEAWAKKTLRNYFFLDVRCSLNVTTWQNWARWPGFVEGRVRSRTMKECA